jgi:hypothetical protein
MDEDDVSALWFDSGGGDGKGKGVDLGPEPRSGGGVVGFCLDGCDQDMDFLLCLGFKAKGGGLRANAAAGAP